MSKWVFKLCITVDTLSFGIHFIVVNAWMIVGKVMLNRVILARIKWKKSKAWKSKIYVRLTRLPQCSYVTLLMWSCIVLCGVCVCVWVNNFPIPSNWHLCVCILFELFCFIVLVLQTTTFWYVRYSDHSDLLNFRLSDHFGLSCHITTVDELNTSLPSTGSIQGFRQRCYHPIYCYQLNAWTLTGHE